MKKLFLSFCICALLPLFSKAQISVHAQVLWGSSWFPATIIDAKSDSWLIHYDGYGDEWNEWVTADRIKPDWQVGTAVSVNFKDQWFPASILAIDGMKFQIHYDGYGSEWDEWVGLDRIKNR